MKKYNKEICLPDEMIGKRLDIVLAELLPEFSRSRIKKWIIDGSITIDQEKKRPRDLVVGGEKILIMIELAENTSGKAEPIDIQVEYEDSDIAVINKPAGLVVHPGAGNPDGTLLNGLLHKWPELSDIPRAGIIHRLDKETSGLMIVTKNLIAHNYLVQELSQRKISREYDAICYGVLTGGGTINEPIARHRTQRKKMSVDSNGKDAITHYRVIKRFRAHTHIKIKLETGRTHQIRVHFAYKRNALLGDPLYSRLMIPPACCKGLEESIREFKRQALCASRLKFLHPTSRNEIEVKISLPPDLKNLLNALENDRDFSE